MVRNCYLLLPMSYVMSIYGRLPSILNFSFFMCDTYDIC